MMMVQGQLSLVSIHINNVICYRRKDVLGLCNSLSEQPSHLLTANVKVMI
jgi:hypothetical protein